MSDRMLPRSASQSATQPCAVDGLPSTSKARAARGIVCSAFVCTLALLLAPAHASDDSASAVLHVRGIDTQSAVRSMRSIGGAQPEPSPQPSLGDFRWSSPAGANTVRLRATGARAVERPSAVREGWAGSQELALTQPPFPNGRGNPVAVLPSPPGRGWRVAPGEGTALATTLMQPEPSPQPSLGDFRWSSPTGANTVRLRATGARAVERPSAVREGWAGSQSTYSQPLLAAVQQAQQPAPSAVIAQSEIGAGNNILLPRAWYDTTPGRIGIFIGASAVASLADRGVKDWALRHQNSAFSRDVIKARDILPWPAFWFAAATSFPSPWANDKLAHTSTVALGAGVLDSVETLALKAVIGRDRPGDSNSPYNFTPFNPRYGLIIGGSSFPSGHTSLTWALITPYARAYNMPWLYALGVASGAGRVMQNAHWFSDVVGGSLLGYFTARWTEEHMNSKANVQWVFTGNGLYMFKSF